MTAFVLAAALALTPAAADRFPPRCDPVVVVVQDISSAGLAYRDLCTVVINDQRWSPRLLCLIVFHEYGHLHGLDHSPRARSVMHYQVGPRTRTPRGCRGG